MARVFVPVLHDGRPLVSAAYKHLTGADVSHMLFRVLSQDEAELWLGASPDGLIAAPAAAAPDGVMAADGHPPGVLETKCPWNRGRPESAKPYPNVPWYYMPQVQAGPVYSRNAFFAQP